MSSTPLKANFAVQNKYGAFFTGGEVKFSKDGEHIFCQCGHTVQVFDVKTGKQTSVIGQDDDDEVTYFDISPDDAFLIVASRSLLLRKWNWKENVIARTWKAIHTGPISSMAFDVTSTLLATGGADSTIKVWDIIKHYCTHNLTGHSGVVSVVAYHPDISRLQLFSAADDYKVRVWDLQTSKCKAILEGHYSVITSLQFSQDGATMYSGGRDNVVIIWNSTELTKTKTIPVYDTIEALVLLPEEGDYSALNVNSKSPHFITGGSKGILKVWDTKTCRCVYPTQEETSEDSAEKPEKSDSAQAITSASYHKELNTINVVTYDHNIYLRNASDLSINKQFVGYNDDVLDMAFFGDGDSHLAVATNSELVKVFETSTWNCQILSGHTDIVLCVGVCMNGALLATGSKDNTIRVWQMDKESKEIQCVAVGNGHTHAVNTVSFSRMKASFLVSGSHDCTLKLWTLPERFENGNIVNLASTATEHSHDKEINSVTVAPNDKLIVSGSQDKTAKLWSSKALSLIGVFRGHKRSIWSVEFSPVDQVIATASADATIKIWALSDFSCVKTFEGHQSSVLRLQFVARGMQLVSSGSDGLLKLWTIKTNVCVGTWDEHDEKVWALAVSKDEENIATGAGDSTICLWKDTTEEEQLENMKKQEEFILQEQQLSNLLLEKKYLKALKLAITLNQPFRVLKIMKEVLDGENGREDAAKTLNKLRDDQIDTVLGYSTAWNTNSKNCHVAQYIVQNTLTNYSPENLMKLPNIRSTIESLLPYTERHFQRMNRLLQQSTFVDYTWQSMKPVSIALEAGPTRSASVSEPMEVDYSSDKDEESGKNTTNRKQLSGKSKFKEIVQLDSDSSSSDSESETDARPVPKKTAVKGKAQTTSDSSSSESESETEAKPEPKKTAVKLGGQSDSDSSSSDSESSDELAAKPVKKNAKKTVEPDSETSSDSENLLVAVPKKTSKEITKESSEESVEESSDEEEQPKTLLRMFRQKKSKAKLLRSPQASDKENDKKMVKKGSNSICTLDGSKGRGTKKTPVKRNAEGTKPESLPKTPIGSASKRRKSPKASPASTKRRKP